MQRLIILLLSLFLLCVVVYGQWSNGLIIQHIIDCTTDDTVCVNFNQGTPYLVICSICPISKYGPACTQGPSQTFSTGVAPNINYTLGTSLQSAAKFYVHCSENEISNGTDTFTKVTSLAVTVSFRESTEIYVDWQFISSVGSLLNYFDVCVIELNICKFNMSSDTRQATFGNIPFGMTFGVNVTAYAIGYSVGFATFTTPPSVPSNFSQTGFNSTSISLYWDEVIGETGPYTYNLCLSGDSCTVYSNGGSNIIIDSLSPSTEYSFSLNAVDKESRISLQVILYARTSPSQVNNIDIGLGATYIYFSWTPLTPAPLPISYTVCLNQTCINTVNSAVTFTNYSLNTYYTATVQPFNQYYSAPAFTKLFMSLPDKPSNLVVLSFNSTSIQYNWTEVPGVTQYQLKIETNQGLVGYYYAKNPPFFVTGLLPSNRYYAHVYSVNEMNSTSYSGDYTDGATAPPDPISFQVDSKNETTILLSWANVTIDPLAEYAITFYLCMQSTATCTPRTSPALITGLTPNTRYNFWLKIRNNRNDFSKTSLAIQTSTIPSTPTSFTYNPFKTNNTDIYFEWVVPNQKNQFLYQIFQVCVEKSLCYNTTDPFLVLNLGSNIRVNTTLQVFNNVGDSSSILYATAVSKSNPMQSFYVSNRTTSSITVNWEKPINNGALNVNATICISVLTSCIDLLISQQIYTFINLISSQDYIIQIFAKNEAGRSQGLSLREATFPNSPSSVIAPLIFPYSISIQWTAPITGSIAIYYYTVCIVNGNCARVDSTVYSAAVLEPSTTYTFTISSTNYFEDVSTNSTITVTTKPKPPADFKIQSRTTTSLYATWNPKSGRSYRICCEEIALCINPSTSSNPNYNFTNLQVNTFYSFNITETFNSVDTIGSLQDSTLPVSPQLSLNGSPTDSQISFTWGNIFGTVPIAEIKLCTDTNICFTSIHPTQYGAVTNLPSSTQFTFSLILRNTRGDASNPSYFIARTLPTSPSGLTVVDYTTNSFTLAWNHTASSYHTFGLIIPEISAIPIFTDLKSITISNLLPNSKYSCFIFAKNLFNETSPMSANPFIVFSKPLPVENITVSERSTTFLNLKWDIPVSQLSLIHKICLNSIGNNLTQNQCHFTNYGFAFYNLKPSQLYQISITSYHDIQFPSDVVYFNTSTQPEMLYNVSIIQTTTKSIFINWNYDQVEIGSSAISRYIICINSCELQKIETTATQLLIPNLSPQSFYTALLYVVNSAEIASVPVNFKFVTSFLPPSIKSVVANADYAIFSFEAPTIALTNESFTYHYVASWFKAGTLVDEEPQVVDSYLNIFGLIPQTEYQIRIKTVAIYLGVVDSDIILYYNFTTKVGYRPSGIPTLTVVSISNTQLLLALEPMSSTFDGGASILEYFVEYAFNDFDAINQRALELISSPITIPEAGGGVVTIESLPSNTVVYLRARGRNVIGYSDYTSTIKVSTTNTADGTSSIIAGSVTTGVIIVVLICVILFCIALLTISIIILLLIQSKMKRRVKIVRPNDIQTIQLAELSDNFKINYNDLSFENSQILGSGAQGTVCTAKYKGAVVAVKMFSKSTLGMQDNILLQDFYTEASTLANHSTHSNIIRLIGVAEDFENSKLCLVTEYLDGGNLASYVEQNKLTFDEKVRIMRDVASAMSYLHNNNIAHRDLKAENILLDHSGMIAKIIDFGLSRRIENSNRTMNLTMNVGTPSYLAPEVIAMEMNSVELGYSEANEQNNTSNSIVSGQKENSIFSSQDCISSSLNNSSIINKKLQYDIKADVYSFAIIMFVVLFENRYPYGKNINELQLMYYVFQKPNFRPKIQDSLVPAEQQWYIELMKQCWQTDPQSRPSFEQIVQAIDKNAKRMI